MFIITYNELKQPIKDMRLQAKYIRNSCRLIKSTTKVGCCIKGSNDLFYTGCNHDYEFTTGIHAEESAIAMMLNSRSTDCNTKIKSIYLYAEVEQFTPCGDCRDKIIHFAENGKTRVFVDNGKIVRCYHIEDLIPFWPIR